MRPLDRRLLKYARVTRVFLAASVVIGTVLAVLAVVQAFALATIITEVFQSGASLGDVMGAVWVLVAVVLARVVLSYLGEVAANASAAQAKSQLRTALLEQVMRLGPVWLARRGEGELSTLATRGVDALDAYYSRYLPMLVLAVTVPIVGGVAILTQDVLAAVIVALTLPLIPVFMVLVGLYTQSRVDRQWRTLGVLSGHFLDVVAGLPTLAVFGRAKAQADSIRRIGDAYRIATLRVLRVSFLSSLVLELLATLSVALIAVSIGLRLVSGDFTLFAGLVVLILAPEVYLPLRLVGANFHAAAEGLGAAEQVFEVLEATPPATGSRTDVPDPATSPIVIDHLTVAYPDRSENALDGATFTIAPGRITALVGPSGGGKSTLLAVLLGFVAPTSGRVSVGGVELADLDPDAWRAQVAYVPQRPRLLAMTLRENVALGAPTATDEAIIAALRAAGADDVLSELPYGLDTELGEGGRGLSVGQQRRVAVARALLRDSPLVLLDEPTAALDVDTEADVLRGLRTHAAGRTVVIVAHRESLAALADDVVRLTAAQPSRVTP
ncbi:MAG: ATP-binding cassette, subfamily bacterial CydD [Actinomycetota bacterium]|nr:ATP-binding cassette, subfamily bacterial CydD [Actinomycetota bacterium]